MKISRERIKDKYETMAPNELAMLLRSGTLAPDATEVAIEVLQSLMDKGTFPGDARNEVVKSIADANWAAMETDRNQVNASSERTSIRGVLILFSGIIGMLYALAMKTSVNAGFGEVNNIGLISDRQTYAIISAVAILAGLILTVKRKGPKSNSNTATDEVPAPATNSKECPKCAELIKKKASKCRFCGSQFNQIL